MSEEKKVDFIGVIKSHIAVFNLIVLLVVFTLLFVSVRFVFKFLDYVPTFSILSILFIVSGLVVIGFYLAKGISKSAIKEITEHRQVEEMNQLQIKRFNVLHSVEKAITSSLDLRATLDILLEQVTDQLNIDAASVLLLNKQTQILEYVVNKGFRSDALKYTKLKLGESNAGRAAIERRIITIPNLRKEIDGFVSSKQFPDEDFITYFAVPLIAKDQIMGVLELFHRSPLASDIEWLVFLETIANQAAIAIDNASLFDGLQRSNIELTLAYDTTIEGWSRALDMRDKETEGHTQRVAEKTLSVAREIRVKEEELVHIKRGALRQIKHTEF